MTRATRPAAGARGLPRGRHAPRDRAPHPRSALPAATLLALVVAGVTAGLLFTARSESQPGHRSAGPATAAGSPAAGAPAPGSHHTAGAQTHAVVGTVTLRDTGSGWAFPGLCAGRGANADIAAGTTVTLYDDTGHDVADSTLNGGSATSATSCTFAFSFDPISFDAASYSLTVSNRAAISRPDDEIARTGYRFDVTLGS